MVAAARNLAPYVPLVSTGGLFRPLSCAADPAAIVEADDTARFLSRAIDRLPADEAAVVRLSFFDGLSVAEAGRRLGLPRLAAWRLQTAAIRRLARLCREAVS